MRWSMWPEQICGKAIRAEVWRTGAVPQLGLHLSALAAGGISLAQHDKHGKGEDYVTLLSQKDIIEGMADAISLLASRE
jgi:hypothetical protein